MVCTNNTNLLQNYRFNETKTSIIANRSALDNYFYFYYLIYLLTQLTNKNSFFLVHLHWLLLDTVTHYTKYSTKFIL